MTDARKETILQLIAVRRQIEALLSTLLTNDDYRAFAKRHLAGEEVRVRQFREYDRPPHDAEELMELYGITPPD